MFTQKKYYGFEDVEIISDSISQISSRKQLSDVTNLIYTAPMDTVCSTPQSLDVFSKARMNVIAPRGFWKTINVEDMLYSYRIAVTLEEAFAILDDETDEHKWFNAYLERFNQLRILIDVANGHLQKVLDVCELLKDFYDYKIDLMAGNVAHPNVYIRYANIGVDSLRIGIGGGSVCLTSAKTAFHYPAISLIDGCRKIKDINSYKTKIIMDGGLKDTSYVIKALAAGADAVMLGSMLNKCFESSSDKFLKSDRYSSGYVKIENIDALSYFKEGSEVYCAYRGMSTNAVQTKEKGFNNSYEEGFSKYNLITHTIDSFVHEFNYAVKSAFTYCGATNLLEFYQNSELILNSQKNHNHI